MSPFVSSETLTVAVSKRSIKITSREPTIAKYIASKLNSYDGLNVVDFCRAASLKNDEVWMNEIRSLDDWKEDDVKKVTVSLAKMVRYLYQIWNRRHGDGTCDGISIDLRRYYETASVRASCWHT